MPEEFEIHETAIVTICDYRDIQRAIEAKGIDFTENARWVAAAQLLRKLDRGKEVLPVLLADATKKQLGIMAWGWAKGITVSGEQTRIELVEVTEIPSRPLITTLFCQSTQSFLSNGDQRNYRIVETPPFICEWPRTILLNWNPKNQDNDTPIELFEDNRRALLKGESRESYWTCRANRLARPGDQFLMLRSGDEPRGIVGCGWLRSYADGDEVDSTPRARILWDWIVDPNKPLNPRSISGAEKVHWSRQGSGTELNEEFCDLVWNAWTDWVEKDISRSVPGQPSFRDETGELEQPEELYEDAASSIEGRVVESWSTRRERDPENRARCLAFYGARCVVCDTSFLEEYGEIGLDFIHVHHERPLGGVTDPNGAHHCAIEDLKPVCPNCHAMLHRGLDTRKGKVRTIEELRGMRKQATAAKHCI